MSDEHEEANIMVPEGYAMEIAAVAESYTRRLVELEFINSDLTDQIAKVARGRQNEADRANEALDRAREANTTAGRGQLRIAELEAALQEVSNDKHDLMERLSAAQARIAELEEQTSEVQHSWREKLDAANKRIAQFEREVALLRRGCAVEYGPLRPLAEEMARARAKFPEQHRLLAALMEEVGETAQAYLEGKPEHAREEALQVACVAMRIYEHGDWDYEPPKAAPDAPDHTAEAHDLVQALREVEKATRNASTHFGSEIFPHAEVAALEANQ